MISCWIYSSIAVICVQSSHPSSHRGTGQFLGPGCQSSTVWDAFTVADKHFDWISFRQLFPHCSLHTYIESKKAVSQHLRAWVILWRSSSIMYQMLYISSNKEGPGPSSQKMCYLLETNGRLLLGQIQSQISCKDSAGCCCWRLQKGNVQKHIPGGSRDRLTGQWENGTCVRKLMAFEGKLNFHWRLKGSGPDRGPSRVGICNTSPVRGGEEDKEEEEEEEEMRDTEHPQIINARQLKSMSCIMLPSCGQTVSTQVINWHNFLEFRHLWII